MLAICSFFGWLAVAAAAQAQDRPLSKDEMVAMLERIDERQRNNGDYRALAFLESKRKNGSNTTQQLLVFRRDQGERLVLLFTRPKGDAGKGFLRAEMNLWFYEPDVGKWERRTERVGIGGTDARRRDFDDWRLSQEFDPAYIAAETLGKVKAHHLTLTAKAGVDVSFPRLELWVDTKTENPLKMESKAESGRLMLTTYYLKWSPMQTPTKKSPLWVAMETRIFNEIDKGDSTTVAVQSVDFGALPQNLFTKAWVEAQSR